MRFVGLAGPSRRVGTAAMQIDTTSLSALSLLARAGETARTLGLPLFDQNQAAAARRGGGPAAADPFQGRPAAITVGSEGLALLQAPQDGRNEARRAPGDPTRPEAQDATEADAEEDRRESGRGSAAVGEEGEGPDGLTPEEREQVRELQRRDTEVRRHENAHAAAGGQYAGAPTYDYQRGPNGQLYAIGGEVRIDSSVVPGNPEATIAKMRIVRRAALAPAEPSPQDLRVASQAQQKLAAAQADLRADRLEERREERAEAEEERETSHAADDPGAADGPVPNGPVPSGDDSAQRALASRQAFAASLATGAPEGPAAGTLFGVDGRPVGREPVDLFA